MNDREIETPTETLVEKAIDAGDGEEAKRLLRHMVADWRRNKDYSINWIAQLLSFVARRLGDGAVEEALRDFGDRYIRDRRGNETTPRKHMEAVVRAMKANGADVRTSEDEERYVLSFRCGSGGMLIDSGAYAPPRDYHVVRTAGPLTYGEPEMPVYCAHCPVNNEIQPIEWDGHPVTIVAEPQREPGGRCVHHVYKEPAAIPAEVYVRVGKRKP